MFQVIAKLEGPAVSQYCALRLLQVETISRIKKKKKKIINSVFKPFFSPFFALLFFFRSYL